MSMSTLYVATFYFIRGVRQTQMYRERGVFGCIADQFFTKAETECSFRKHLNPFGILPESWDAVSLSVSLLRLNRAKSSGELLLGSPRASNRIAMTLVPAKPSPNRSSLEEKPKLHCNKMTWVNVVQIYYSNPLFNWKEIHMYKLVYDWNQVSVLVNETKVQFWYQYWSRNFAFGNRNFFFSKKKSNFCHVFPLLGLVKIFISFKKI